MTFLPEMIIRQGRRGLFAAHGLWPSSESIFVAASCASWRPRASWTSSARRASRPSRSRSSRSAILSDLSMNSSNSVIGTRQREGLLDQHSACRDRRISFQYNQRILDLLRLRVKVDASEIEVVQHFAVGDEGQHSQRNEMAFVLFMDRRR